MEQQEKEITFEFDPSRFFESFIRVGRELLFRPRDFYRQLPEGEHLKNPFVFLVICAFLSSLFTANMRNGDFKLFIVLLVSNTVSAFIGSFVLHSIISKLFGSKSPFESTFRILAYASLMDVVSWIPVLGPIAYFYSLYLIFIGLQEIHHLKPRQAGATILLIVLIITLLLTSLIFMAPESLQEGIRLMDPDNAGF